jgi:hypothetical protein
MKGKNLYAKDYFFKGNLESAILKSKNAKRSRWCELDSATYILEICAEFFDDLEMSKNHTLEYLRKWIIDYYIEDIKLTSNLLLF